MMNGLYKFGENFMKAVAVIFSAMIFITALLLTSYNYDMTGHWFDVKWDNFPVTFIGIAIVFAVGFLIYWLCKKNMNKSLRVLLVIVIAWYLIACEYLAFFGRSMPNSDSWVVYAMAKQMAAGDLSIINPTESYMSYYPQQIGICAFLSILIRVIDLFHVSAEEFHFLIAIYGLMECVTVFCLYKTVDSIWGNNKVNFIFLYLSIFNFSYIMYSSYLYGEVPALMFFSIGTAALSDLLAGGRKPVVDMVVSIIAFALAVWTRKNSLILIIGVLIVLLFEFFKTKKWRFLITCGLIGVSAFMILPVTVRYYETKAGNTLSTGVTAMSYIAMGLQDDSDTLNNNPGWYNGFNITTFEESGCNPDAANIVAKEAWQESINYYRSNPAKFFKFIAKKFATQWTDGTYFSGESTHNYYGDRSEFLMSVYYGEYRSYYIEACNIFQTIIFLGVFLWAILVNTRFGKNNLWKTFMFIGVFGGFLFHMIWEANSRYIITYACLLVPYAASGYGTFFGGLKRKHG